jgi:hypothetical protein
LIDSHAEFAIARQHNLIISAAAQGKRYQRWESGQVKIVLHNVNRKNKNS